MTDVKKLDNEMKIIEEESTKFVLPQEHYIIKVTFNKSVQNLMEITVSLLNDSPKPIATYCCDNKILIIFSRVNDQESHQLEGEYSSIISKYMRLLMNMIQSTNLCVRIVTFTTQTQVFTYLSWTMFQSSRDCIINLSKGNITTKDIRFRTEIELKISLEEGGVIWDDVPNFKKYGTLFKLKTKKDKMVVVKITEMLDARESKKTINFLFS